MIFVSIEDAVGSRLNHHYWCSSDSQSVQFFYFLLSPLIALWLN